MIRVLRGFDARVFACRTFGRDFYIYFRTDQWWDYDIVLYQNICLVSQKFNRKSDPDLEGHLSLDEN